MPPLARSLPLSLSLSSLSPPTRFDPLARPRVLSPSLSCLPLVPCPSPILTLFCASLDITPFPPDSTFWASDYGVNGPISPTRPKKAKTGLKAGLVSPEQTR